MTEYKGAQQGTLSINEQIWHSVDPIQDTGDVPVYQQCSIGTTVGKVMRDYSQ